MNSDLNFVGGGTHEIAALCRDGVLIVGHFDSVQKADNAIAELTECCSIWSTLNPVASLPAGRVLNPSRLSRGLRVGAKHIGYRASLLFDFDPPRPPGLMSTDEEHQAAIRQARDCNAFLQTLGWPVLALCDSGSGAHLRAEVHMDVSAETTRLIQRALLAVRERFPFVDVGMWDLPRLCRYYGTWNCKSDENNSERPWRMSRVLKQGDETLVTIAHLEHLRETIAVPMIAPAGHGIARPEAQEKFVRRFTAYCDRIGVTVWAIRQLGDGTVMVSTEFCLLNEEHTGSSCGVGVGADGTRKNLCKHNGCAMPWALWARLVEEKYSEPMRLDGVIRWR
jgi:hypothetical protein